MPGTPTWSKYAVPSFTSSHTRLTWYQANPQYVSVNWEASGGGAFAVIPINEKGKLPEHIPLFRGHTAPVLDTDWYAKCAEARQHEQERS